MIIILRSASLTKFADQDVTTTLFAFAGLGVIHLYSAHRCVRHVPLATLNSTRLELLVASRMEYIAKVEAAECAHNYVYEYPSAAEIAERDPMMCEVWSGYRTDAAPHIVCVYEFHTPSRIVDF